MKKQIWSAGTLTMWAAIAVAGSDDQTLRQLDSNADGLIGVHEAAEMPKLGIWFIELDQDANAQLDAAEFARFELLDAPLTAAD